VNPEEAREMTRRLPRGRLVELDDAGHAPILEQHERFSRELDRFARRRLRASPPHRGERAG
jgi:pimeloyl-ACP methyl ester carboxylesterase